MIESIYQGIQGGGAKRVIDRVILVVMHLRKDFYGKGYYGYQNRLIQLYKVQMVGLQVLRILVVKDWAI